ncbi:MAG: RecQ family ATP-dependent DNA helicase, partial [Verrucomicrobiales bacterium]
MSSASDLLRRHFGHAAFRPGQEEVIASLLAGRPALAVFPTGGGKSLCYQLPALALDGLTLVISPLIALMRDQVEALRAKKIPAARLDSTLDPAESQEIMAQLSSGQLKLLYIAPERLANESFRRRLARTRLSLLAIDEAHCISEWGHNFRPDYLKLARFAEEQGITRVLALTATATPEVAADIRRHFHIASADHHQLSFHRANLDLRVTPACDPERRALLLDRLRAAPAGDSAIIYLTLQHQTESLAAFLQQNGLPARPYHAGLRPETRAEIQNEFMSGKTPLICATIAFGMGIDKADIRAVYHFHLPKSLENYSQEIGRAGRDGQPSRCELFACAADLRTLENFIHGDNPGEHALRSLLRRLFDQPARFDLSLYELSTSHDIRPHVLETVLTYLELAGYLRPLGKFRTRFQLRLLRPLHRILAGHPAETRHLLSELLALGEEKRSFLHLDLPAAAQELQRPRSELLDLLNELESHGDASVKGSHVHQEFDLLKRPEDLRALIDELVARFARREESEFARLRKVRAFAESADCRNTLLLAHFGEPSAPCG